MSDQSDPKHKPTGDYVFISYAREDQTYTRNLVEDLHRHGIETWIDDRIDFGDRWWLTIVQAIRDSAAFVVVMTPKSEASKWVEREVMLAEDEGKPIFPLLLRGKVFPLFIITQYVDVTNTQMPPVEFYERLGRVVSQKPKAEKKQKRPVAPLQPRQEIITPTPQEFELELILIPAGEFLMGSDPNVDKDARDYEQPQHCLYLSDYYIAKTPVTNAQYVAFVQASGNDWESWRRPLVGKQDHPVGGVNFDDAVAYCNWLTEVTGKTYRLPTEAEWEKAARGTDGRIYPWGNRWDKRLCNTREGGPEETTPVGAYPDGASPYGLLDMAGNVFEWCATRWKDSYPYDIEEDKWIEDYLQTYAHWVLRGGSLSSRRDYARCASRYWNLPNGWYRNFGFRVVVSPSSPPPAR